MTVIKCYECGNEMSEYANICPKCGCPLVKAGKKKSFI